MMAIENKEFTGSYMEKMNLVRDKKLYNIHGEMISLL